MTLASWLRSFTNTSQQPTRRGRRRAERHRGRSLQENRRRATGRLTPPARRSLRRGGVERLEDRTLLSAGQLDPTFGNAGVVSTNIGGPTNTSAKALVVTQTDGKTVVVAQNDDSYAGGARTDVVRYNADGSLDSNFGNHGEVVFPFSDNLGSPGGVALDSSGRIIVAGSHFNPNVGADQFAVARLNSDGSFDNSFASNGIALLPQFGRGAFENDSGASVAIDSSGNIIVAGTAAGYFSDGYGQRFAVARLNDDGSLDNTFGSGGQATVSFGTAYESDIVSSVALDSAGHIVLAGSTEGYNSSYSPLAFAVARLNTDGSLDATFNGTGKATIHQFGTSASELDIASSEAIDSSGNIIVAGTAEGSFSDGDGDRFAVARLSASGALDSSFGTGGKTTVNIRGLTSEDDYAPGMALDSSGHIVVAGTALISLSNYYPQEDFAVARLNSDGSLDTSFASSGKTTISFAGYDDDRAAGVAIDPSGQIVVAGTVNSTAVGAAIGVARLNADGSLDGAWGSGGLVTTSIQGTSIDEATNMTITQPDGKILVVGLTTPQSAYVRNLAVTRYNPDGTLDSTFGQGGKAVFDDTSGVFLDATSVAVDSAGHIDIAGGTSTSYGERFAVVRLNSDGSLDTTFGTDGEAVLPPFGGSSIHYEQDSVAGLAIDSSGRIVLAGTASSYGSTEFAVARLNPDGSLDTSFANGGEETISGFTNSSYEYDTASGVVIDASGRIVVAGITYYGYGTPHGVGVAVARLNSDGTLDTSFASGGTTTFGLPSGSDVEDVVGVSLDPSGRIVVGGDYASFSPSYSQGFMAARLNAADGSLDQSFGVGGVSTFNWTAAFGQTPYPFYAWSRRMSVDGSGRVAVVGDLYGDGVGIAAAMFNANGYPDVDFGADGAVSTQVGTSDDVSGAAFDSSGRLVVTGTGGGSFIVVRYLPHDQVVEAGSATFASDLQAAVTSLGANPPPGTPQLVIHVADQAQMAAVAPALANLSVVPNEPEIEVMLDIDPGTYSMGQISVPSGLKLIIDGDNAACGARTLTGTTAAALTVASGDVLIRSGMAFDTSGQSDLVVTGGTVDVQNDSFAETGGAPAILVTGGQLTMRGSSVTENTSTDQAAIAITGGQVDLGTSNTYLDPNVGNNTISVNGSGVAIRLAGPNDVMALGDSFVLNGNYLYDNYQIEDVIDHSLDGFGPGTVYWVPDNVFVSTRDGVIQTGVNVIPSGGTVNVETGVKGPFNVGSKLLTIAYQSGPFVTQQADTLNASQVELVYSTYSSNDSVKFVAGTNPGQVQMNINNLPNGTFLPTGRLVAYAGYGDNITVDSTLTLSAWLFGNGGGRMKGGGGNNVLIDDGGNELLVGGSARDLIIGNGGDRLVSNGGQDILIAGYYSYEFDETALAAIMAEWTSADSLAARVADLTDDTASPYFSASRLNGNYFLLGSGPDQTVFQDFSADTLTAGSGPDLVLASSSDTVHGLTAADLDFIING
jgi:uncharacterized delta-60 repeat protein